MVDEEFLPSCDFVLQFYLSRNLGSSRLPNQRVSGRPACESRIESYRPTRRQDSKCNAYTQTRNRRESSFVPAGAGAPYQPTQKLPLSLKTD